MIAMSIFKNPKGNAKRVWQVSEETKLINDKVFDYLPFSSEPFSDWNNKTDLQEFLFALHDKKGSIVGENGVKTPVNYRDYGGEVFERGKKEIQSLIQQFETAAEKAVPAPVSVTQKIEVPRFSVNPEFGKVAKYFVAYGGVVEDVLSEESFFSIEHVLESEADLECSVYLAAHLYYKQALQILRSFLEDLVLPIHFCGNTDDYLAWKSSDYKTPPLRGKHGIANKLVKRHILSNRTANEISNLYGDLNACVHGAEKRLLNRGIYSGRWTGQIFKYSDFEEWAEYFSRSVDLGISLLKTSIIQWQMVKPHGKRFCSICHNDKDFDTERYEFGGEWYKRYRCLKCGNMMIFGD